MGAFPQHIGGEAVKRVAFSTTFTLRFGGTASRA
jgi:hypothetical protein